MTKSNERPQAFVGIGGVVGPETEQRLVKIAEDLAVSRHDRQLVLAVNATHMGQMEDRRNDRRATDEAWNPVGEEQFRTALIGGYADAGVLSVARVQLSPDHMTNPGYIDFFPDQIARRSGDWADALQVDGFTLDQGRDQEAAPLRIAHRAEDSYGSKKLILGFELPDGEVLEQEGVLENITTLFARLAFKAEYIALNSNRLDADAARTLLDTIYATTDLEGTGFVIHDKADKKALELAGQYPDLSVYAENSLRTPTGSVEVEKAREYVEAALRSIDAPVAEIVK